jgi:3-oxoacyl-[acyl-carrier-protein] synthase-3
MITSDIRALDTQRFAKIISTGTYVPENVMTNDDIIKKYNLIATDRAVKKSLGISERRWDDKNFEMADFIALAVQDCLSKTNVSIEDVDRIIFAKLVGDYQVPSTAIGLLKKLNISKGIPAFDIATACSGFIHAMDMAIRYIDSGDDYVLIVGGAALSWSVNTFSNFVNPQLVFLFGDAFSAMLLGRSDIKHFYYSYLYTNSDYYNVGYCPLGTSLLNHTKQFSRDIWGMKIDDGKLLHNSTIEAAEDTFKTLLDYSGLKVEDIDIFVTSDQTTRVWEGQIKALNIPAEKSVSLFQRHGNTASAMSPLNLQELVDTGRLKRGMLVMMMAHGAGASGGGIIFRY